MYIRGKKLAFVAALFAAVFLLSATPVRAFNWSTWWNPRTWFTPPTQYSGSVAGRVTVGGNSPSPINIVAVSVDGKPAPLTSTGSFSMTVDLGSSVARSNVPVRFDYVATPQPSEPSKTYFVTVSANQITPQSHGFLSPVLNYAASVHGVVKDTSGNTVSGSKVTVAGTDVFTGTNGVYNRSNIPLSTNPQVITVSFACTAPVTSSSSSVSSGDNTVNFSNCPTSGGGGGGGGTPPPPPPTNGTFDGYATILATGLPIKDVDVTSQSTTNVPSGDKHTTNGTGYYQPFSVEGASRVIKVTFTLTDLAIAANPTLQHKCLISFQYIHSTDHHNISCPFITAADEITLKGTIKIDGLPAAPAKGAAVYLNQGAYGATTDDHGRYTITSPTLKPGNYNFNVTLDGVAQPYSEPKLSLVTGPNNVKDVTLQPIATDLRGTVFYRGTKIPVSDAGLSLFQPNDTSFNHFLYPKTAISDKTGQYTLSQILPGTAKIAVSGTNLASATVTPPALVAGHNSYDVNVDSCAPNYVKGMISSSDGKALPSKIVLVIYDNFGSSVYQTIYPAKTATTVFYSSKGHDNHGYINGTYKVRVELEKNSSTDTSLAPEKTIVFTSDCGTNATADFSLIYTATEAMKPTYQFVVRQSYYGASWIGAEPMGNVRLSVHEDFDSGTFTTTANPEGIATLKDVTGNISKSTMVTLEVFGTDGKRLQVVPGLFTPNPTQAVNTILVTVMSQKSDVCVKYKNANNNDFWICLPPSEADEFVRRYSTVLDDINTQVNYLRGLYPIASDDPPELDVVSAGKMSMPFAGATLPSPPGCLNPDHPDAAFNDNRIYLNAAQFHGSLDHIKFVMKGVITHEFGHFLDWKKRGCADWSSDKTLKDLDAEINANPLFADFYSTIDKVENGQGHAWELRTEFYATGFDIFHNYRPAMDAVIAALEITNPKKAAAWRGAMKTVYDTVTSQALST